ncbi:MAG: hypothetical protein K2L48_00510 [Mycoplasmoidaceae bacterium]|nr:hypothetical protein [Mycoplasmoidaceae bacterium]
MIHNLQALCETKYLAREPAGTIDASAFSSVADIGTVQITNQQKTYTSQQLLEFLQTKGGLPVG